MQWQHSVIPPSRIHMSEKATYMACQESPLNHACVGGGFHVRPPVHPSLHSIIFHPPSLIHFVIPSSPKDKDARPPPLRQCRRHRPAPLPPLMSPS